MTVETARIIEESEASVVGIFCRAIDADSAPLSVETARAILGFTFTEADQARMTELATLNSAGKISDDERTEMMNYVRVNQILGVMHSKARFALKGQKAAKQTVAR